jgi:putative hydrolase of the HAD superfamily
VLPDRCAVIFDLDDTLYRYRRFQLGGFAAVAAYLARHHGIDPWRAVRCLVRASHGAARGRELQVCLAAFRLPQGLLPTLVRIVREHHPRLRLRAAVVRTLDDLRGAGFRLAVLTNGPREIQARKIGALGLARYVDSVVFATEHGSRTGKPDPAPFREVLTRLSVSPARAVMVGDDERCDIEGGRSAGLRTVRLVTRTLDVPSGADRTIGRWADLPGAIQALVRQEQTTHAA